MTKEYSRVQRVADQIQRELAVILQREVKDPRLAMMSINSVEVSRDFSFAKVYVSFIGGSENKDVAGAMSALNKATGFLRSKLAKELKLRIIPLPKFFYDDTLERGQKMSALIDSALASDQKPGSIE